MEILRQDHFVVAAGSASPWATRKRIRLKDLIDEQWILFPRVTLSGPHRSDLSGNRPGAAQDHCGDVLDAPDDASTFHGSLSDDRSGLGGALSHEALVIESASGGYVPASSTDRRLYVEEPDHQPRRSRVPGARTGRGALDPMNPQGPC